MDEKQLQFLFNEYAKGKGFKDFSEFKGLMESEPNRKMFFDESNKELGFKDYNEFNDLLGLKKKDGGVVSSPIPSKLPSKSYLEQGREFAEKGFTMPMAKTSGGKVKVSANPLQPFLPNVEVGEDVPSYTNIAQRFANDLLITGSKGVSGLANIMRDIGEKSPELYEEGKPTKYAKEITWAKDPFGKVVLGLNGITESAEGLNEAKPMPDTFIGNTLKVASEIAPDIMLSGLMPEAKLAEGASLMQKAANLIVNPFTKYMMVKEPLTGYAEARKSGKTDIEAMKEIPSNIGKGFATGAEMALIGAGSGYATNATMKAAEKAGLTGAKGMAAKELANLAYDLIGYSYISPATHTLYEEGRLPNMDEISSGAGIALMFRAKDAIKNVKNYRQLNSEVDNILQARQTSALNNFIDATPESIAEVYKNGVSANDLNLKALEAAKKAKEATNIEEKQKAVAQASVLAKAANVKQMADLVVSNKDNFEQLRNSDLPDAMKQQFLDKAASVNKLINPIEIQKTDIGNKINQAEQFKSEMDQLAKIEQDPVKKAQAEFRSAEADKMINKYKEDLNKIFSGEQKDFESHEKEKEAFTQDVNEFANRIMKGERMESPEDLQFYDNNKSEIENILKQNAEKINFAEKPIDIEKPLVQEPEKPFVSSQKHTVEFDNGNLIVKDKSGNILSDRASKKALEEYADKFDYSKGERIESVPPEIQNEREALRYVVENTKNPLEVTEVYSREEPMPFESDAKMQAIAENGLGRIKTSSYERFGDPNKIEKSMYLNIFSEQRGVTIDQLAKSISDRFDIKIEPQDIVEYIEKYSRGDKKALQLQETDIQRLAKDKFKELTGLDLTPELANKIFDKELEKANQDQLEIIKQDYETAQQLEDAYWKAYAETDGFTKESPVSKADEAKSTEKSLEQAYKDLTRNEKRRIINSKFEELVKELKIEKICP